ncbi:hypothetical protein NLJ89_g6543 [Agrocybe chaxingu]|uniref:Ribonuclease H1 N-terminal domain-containing protein n=1 Tax=Agrocybe chaxingu TaxID=84603 RepID=A0A9W8MUI7_9AGAR|nr:hypothetical protein NLJ89_g6543 [Agrocybe chaxingu]
MTTITRSPIAPEDDPLFPEEDAPEGSTNVSHGDTPIIPLPLLPVTWEDFFRKREEANAKIIEKESPIDRERRLNRERKPPIRKVKVFEWTENDDGVLVCTPVLGRDKTSIFSCYSADQIRYDAFRNEYDCCEEFAPGGVPMGDYDDGDWDGEVTEDQLAIPDPESTPYVAIPALQESQDHMVADLALPKEVNDEIFKVQQLDTFEAEILELVQRWYGYIPPLSTPKLRPLSDESEQKNFLKLFGIQWGLGPLSVFEKSSISAVADFMKRLINKSGISSQEWDLGKDHRRSLLLNRRLASIRAVTLQNQPSEMLYMFDFKAESTVDWKLATTSASHALMLCRLNPDWKERELASYMLENGIAFRTLKPSSLLPRSPIVKDPAPSHPFRLAGYNFSIQDYSSYLYRCWELLKQPRGRAALLQGGYIWRLAAPVVSFDDVLHGPTGWSSAPEEMLLVRIPSTGEEFIDDQLTEHELEILSGLNICMTGHGEQIAKRSWHPLFKTYQHSGLDYGRWTSFSEKNFNVIADGREKVSAASDVNKFKGDLGTTVELISPTMNAGKAKKIDDSHFVYLLLGATWWNQFSAIHEISVLPFRPNDTPQPVLIRCKIENARFILSLRQQFIKIGFGTSPIDQQVLATNVATAEFLSSALPSDVMWYGNAFGRYQGVYQKFNHVKEANYGVGKPKFRRFKSLQGALAFVICGGDTDFCVRHGFLPPTVTLSQELQSSNSDNPSTSTSIPYLFPSSQGHRPSPSAPATPKGPGSGSKVSNPTLHHVSRHSLDNSSSLHTETATESTSTMSSGFSTPNVASTPPSISLSTAFVKDVIYTFWRDLKGIFAADFRRPLSERVVGDVLGEVIESYLVSHGFDDPSIETIQAVYFDSSDRQEFVYTLQQYGATATEAMWIWDHVRVGDW